jgi:hypothetical protein
MSRTRLFSTLSLLVFALTGCGADGSDPSGPSGGGPGGSGGGTQSVVGTYDLVSLDGHPLPAPLGSPIVEPEYTIKAEIHLGYIQLNPDGTFLYEVIGQVVATGVPYQQDIVFQHVGIYQIGENAITLTNGDGSNSGVTHTFSNGRITAVSIYPGPDGSDVSATMVFQKE